MPEINRVSFQYGPVGGSLKFDAFRQTFYTERVQHVRDTLQYLCFAFDVVEAVEGEIRFSEADGEPPQIRDVRYVNPRTRARVGRPFPDSTVALWPASDGSEA